MDNQKFNALKELHPEWSDEQIWTAVSLNMETDKVFKNATGDIDPNDPDILKEIITGAQNWLREVLPDVFAKVAHFFERVILTMGEWIQKGLSFVVDAIAKLFD